MDTEKVLTDTRRVIKMGKNGLAVIIKKDIAGALGIIEGSLVKIEISNTGEMAQPDLRPKKKKEVESDVAAKKEVVI